MFIFNTKYNMLKGMINMALVSSDVVKNACKGGKKSGSKKSGSKNRCKEKTLLDI